MWVSQEIAKQNCNAEREKHFNLYKLLESLQTDIIDCDEGEISVINNSIVVARAKLNVINTKQVKSSAFRCKAKFYSEGECSSKYFFGMEKHNYVNKTMYSVRRQDGTLTKDYQEILNIQKDFYEKLYTADDQIEFAVLNKNNVRLNELQKQQLDTPLMQDEIFDALMTLKTGKTPGCDGLTLEFYCKFYGKIKSILFNVYIDCIENGKLNPSARKGMICLIPKKRKDGTYVKNWQPLTLLNYDYKILAKVISNRLESVVQELIGPQQCGFIKNRSIFQNILRTKEVIAYTKKANIPGLIITIDFEKCFDRVEYVAVWGALQYFNFGKYLIDLVLLLYQEFYIFTCNNGHQSQLFRKNRGSNQGCPASPGIFLYISEVMSHLIAENSKIGGIAVPALHDLLSQFADDTNAFLKYE